MIRQPSLIDKQFYRLLLVKIQLEERVADLAKLLFGVTLFEVSPDHLQLELPSCAEHNDDSEEEGVEYEESVYATLTYYMVEDTAGAIAVVRFHASDEDEYQVAEATYPDTAAGYCKFQQQVSKALDAGVDVCIMTSHDPEEFPEINAYLEDVPATDI